ncbi:MYCBP-associated protein [Onthophagus taurus]|uniref:MYCBP-associated protein n=1 Tax=Onthophagus taurus TaxID=166361 RepID=UPI0039BE9A37
MSFTDLPSVREIINEESLRSGLLKQQSVEKIEKDRRLANWKKLLNDRKKLCNRLSKKLSRHHCDLLTNYGDGESLNKIKREKLVLGYATIPFPHDKYRGNPSFFQIPVALSRKHENDPDYFAFRTKPEENLIPEVEYVGVPTCIQTEKKMICPGYRNVKDLWMESAYRKQRVEELQEQLKIVEPYKPELDDLCMMGKGIKPARDVIALHKPSKKTKDDFKICCEEYHAKKFVAKSNIHENEEYITLNNLRMCPHTKKNRELYLDFDYDVESGKALTKSVEIKNGTSVALRYNFTQAKKCNLFQDITEYDTQQVFFFDKRINIILPDETKHFHIHFKTSEISFYNFTLEMHIIPRIFNLSFIIHLNGISSKQNLDERIEILKHYISDKVSNNIARDVVEDILKNLESSQPHITLYTYDRGYIFDAVNQQYTATTRRPKYVYNKDVVDELEEFYAQIRFKGCPPYWNYDVENLKKITMKREKLNRQKDLLDQIYLMRLEDLKRRKGQGENVDEEVGCVVDKSDEENNEEKNEGNIDEELIVEEVPQPFSERLDSIIQEVKNLIDAKKLEQKESLLTKLENILLKLDKTCYSVNNSYDAHGYVYGTLCITFDKILREVEKVKETFQITTVDRYPKHLRLNLDLIQNQVFLDEEQPKYPKLIQDFAQKGQPPSELLKDIPNENVEAKHLAYYGPPKEDDTGKKGKKGKDAKAPKDKPEKGAKGKDKSQKLERPPTPQIDLKPVQDFADPFKKQSLPSQSSTSNDDLESKNATTASITTTTTNRFEEYTKSLYKVFYKNLSDAVLKISDILETNKPRKLKMSQFQTIWKHKLTQKSVKVKYIDIKKTLCAVMGMKSKKIQKIIKRKRKQQQVMELPEALQPKQSGSLWSILRPLKKPVPSTRPISFPELSLLVRKRTLAAKDIGIDVSTIMSVCSGFDTHFEPILEMEVQAESKTDTSHTPPPVPWESKGVAAGVVQDIVDEVCEEVKSGENIESFEYLQDLICVDEGEEEEDSDVFFDDDLDLDDLSACENLEMNDLYNT